MNDGITNTIGMSLSKLQEMVKGRESQRVEHDWTPEQWQEAVLQWMMIQQIRKMTS